MNRTTTILSPDPRRALPRHHARRRRPPPPSPRIVSLNNTGLQYNRARYYSPSTARFISQDPLGYAGSGTDLYQYAADNPINNTDPSGQSILDDIGLGCVGKVLSGAKDAAGSFGCVLHVGSLLVAPEEGAISDEALAAEAGTALVPKATISLGRWGETRLADVLAGAGYKPSSPFITSLGRRYVDRLVNGVAYEAKAGIDVGLTSAIRLQAQKDAELVATGQVRGAVWYFFQGAQQDTLDYLGNLGIRTVEVP